MRILHVVPTYLPARRYGGPIIAVHGLSKALVNRGHEIDVFTTNVDGKDVSDVPLKTPVEVDGVRVYYFPSPIPRLYWSPAMQSALATSVTNYDLLHLHSVFLYPTTAAARSASKHRVPYIIAPRGMLVPELIRQKSAIVKTMWIRFFERQNFRHAAAIHFTSQRECDDARKVGLPLPAPFIVPNGIDLRPQPAISRDDRTILFLGRINWKKGIDRLISALPLIEGARLTIAGNDEEDYSPRLHALANRLGVSDRIRFVGSVSGQAKDELFARATLFVLPSLSENFGNTILESMAMETPVVVTPEVGLADVVRQSGSGVVANGTPECLAAAISALLNDNANRISMGKCGRRTVEERFTWQRVAQQMEVEYAAICQ